MAAARTQLPDLVKVTTTAIAAMTWLTPSDEAMKQLALRYAFEIQAAVGTPDQTKTVGWLGPQLQIALRSLGGAPAERKALGDGSEVKGALAKLRSVR